MRRAPALRPHLTWTTLCKTLWWWTGLKVGPERPFKGRKTGKLLLPQLPRRSNKSTSTVMSKIKNVTGTNKDVQRHHRARRPISAHQSLQERRRRRRRPPRVVAAAPAVPAAVAALPRRLPALPRPVTVTPRRPSRHRRLRQTCLLLKRVLVGRKAEARLLKGAKSQSLVKLVEEALANRHCRNRSR